MRPLLPHHFNSVHTWKLLKGYLGCEQEQLEYALAHFLQSDFEFPLKKRIATLTKDGHRERIVLLKSISLKNQRQVSAERFYENPL